MPFNIFVSYSTRDFDIVERVRQALDGPGIGVFIAERSVEPSQSLPTEVLAAIKGSDLFIVLWSRHSRVSEWVPQEIGAAKAAGKPILPILLEQGIRLPAFIADLKYLSAQDDPEAGLLWLRQNVLGRVAKKQQAEAIGWAALGVLSILVLGSK